MLELIAADPSVDVIVIGITGALGAMTDNFGADILEFAPRSPKPIVVTWNSPKIDEPGFAAVVASGVPLFRSFRNCFGALRSYALYRERAAAFRSRAPLAVTDHQRAAARVALAAPGALNSASGRELLAAFGVPLVREETAESAAAAVAATQTIGFPVVMKVSSPDFPHKSDAGLVRLNVGEAATVAHVFDELVAQAHAVDPSARVDGVVVQQQLAGGVEMIVGATNDAVLGPAVVVGTGGIFAEVLEDIAVRPLPLDADDARDMVRSLRGHALLVGARGRAPADEDALVAVILAVARLCTAAAGRLDELDLNPVLAGPDGAVAVDWLVIAGDGGELVPGS
jgi:acyl-CoA synthetase (NDP forming)